MSSLAGAGVTLEDLLKGSIQGLAVLRRDHFLYASDRFAGFFATTAGALVGRTIGSLISTDSLDRLRKAGRRRTAQELELDGVGPEIAEGLRLRAVVHRITWDGKPALQITAIDGAAPPRDVPGQLPSRFIHDFNNYLAVILGNLELASSAIDQGSRTARHLNGASSAARKASKLTQQLLRKRVSPSEDR